jgi:hypothetical protein
VKENSFLANWLKKSDAKKRKSLDSDNEASKKDETPNKKQKTESPE